MFEIGFSEILLVFVIGLIVLGPERLPGVVRTAAKWIGAVRSMSATVQQQISEELQLENIKKDLSAGLSSAGELKVGVKSSLREAGSTLSDIDKELQASTSAIVKHDEIPVKHHS